MKQLRLFTIIGIVFVLLAGSLAHFLYDWTGNNFLIGLVTPVNESVWEHMKLLFFPMLIYACVMFFACRAKYPCVASALCFGLLTGSFLIPALYYAYTFLLGRNIFFLDIAVFAGSTLAAFLLAYKFALSCRLKPYSAFLFILVCILFICFVRFSYAPPALAIFADPTKGNP